MDLICDDLLRLRANKTNPIKGDTKRERRMIDFLEYKTNSGFDSVGSLFVPKSNFIFDKCNDLLNR